MAEENAVMTMDELCAYLRVHKSTIYRMLKKRTGAIPAFHVGSDWRFNRRQIEKWTRSLEIKVG